MSRWFGILIVLGVCLVIGVAFWRSLNSTRDPAVASGPPGRFQPYDAGCTGSVAFTRAAERNAHTVGAIDWAPFGRREIGWRTYWPLVAHEIGSGCGPATPAFAQAMAAWQQARGHRPDGVLTTGQFQEMKISWHSRRPYVALRASGVCPEPPNASTLAVADESESYGGKRIEVGAATLAAYRRMVAAARQEVPGLKDHPEMLDIFSGYRSPAYDAARCARDGNCQGITRAKCSVHRTGTALDLVVGNAPGHSVDSSADPNRLHMAQTPAYQWLVANAHRFGFVNYAFEPWHWEWVGQTMAERKTTSAP